MEKNKTQKPASPKKSPRLQPQCVSYSAAASGPHSGYQGTDALASLPGSPYQAAHATDTHPRGWVRRAGSPPPCAASFFPYSFFAGEERIWPPEGASPLAWKKLRRNGYHPSKKTIKSPQQCVSYSEAASGPHTGYQGTDALASLSGSLYCSTRTTDTHPRGWVRRAGSPPRLARRLSFHILSSPKKKEYGPRRAPALLHGKN